MIQLFSKQGHLQKSTFYLIAAICIILETSLGNYLFYPLDQVRISYILVLIPALSLDASRAYIHGWFVGLIRDFFSMAFFGAFAMIFSVLAFLVSFLKSYFNTKQFTQILLICTASQILVDGFYFLVIGLSGGNPFPLPGTIVLSSKILLSTLVGTIVLTGLFALETITHRSREVNNEQLGVDNGELQDQHFRSKASV